MVGAICALSVISLSEKYLAAGAAGASALEASGALALAGRYWTADLMLTVFFILGALVLYALLFTSRLVPRFISIWGLFAVAALITANVAGVPDLTHGFNPGQLLYFPIMVSEILLAIWLIVKGFNPSATAEPAG